MKKLIFGLVIAAGLGLAGCQKSVESEVKDVNDAQRTASENIADKERELQDTKIEEGKKILDEKREAVDAVNDANKNNPNTPVVPGPAVP
jgi:hypothetical protein